ncbi:flagellar filament capping protein FliD [Clostridium sp.]|uniref:flagellar filament capping protein FliD n=1 Tax=Clostridium sp. TaxID=1506 RepID=UPI002FDDBD5F
MATSTTSSVPVGSTGAGGGNTLRITGLNTGLDIDAMVKKMLTADQTKVDQAKQQQQLITWKQDAYKEIITSLKDLQSAYFDVANSANYLLSSSSYSNMAVSSSDSTIVSAKALTNAEVGTYKIKVTELASSAEIKSSSAITLDGKLAKSSDTLKSLGIDEGNISLKFSYNDGSTTKEATVNFNVTSSSTFQDLADAIKNKTNGAVTAKINELTGEFSIQTAATGKLSKLGIAVETYETDAETQNRTTNLMSKLKISAVEMDSNEGEDAVVSIKEPGSSDYISTTQSSNSFTINGVSYNVADITSTGEEVSISVTRDTSKVHDLISNFIDKYNEIVGTLQDKLSEKKDYDYKPLTDSQKSSMSDTDISNWEKKAKQGILRNDDNLQNLLDSLANAFTTPVVDSSGNNVSTLYFGKRGDNAIGIDTSSKISEGAKISIVDDQKLTDAIANHPEELIKLFTTKSDSEDSTKKFQQSGIFERIDQILDDNVGVIGSTLNEAVLTKYANVQDDYSTTGGGGTGTLPDQLYQQQLLITNLTEIMNEHQTKYYNQFTQLEVAMEKLNAQQSTLAMYLS